MIAMAIGEQCRHDDDDGDGIGMPTPDNVPDLSDAFPLDPAETTDTDGDGIGNNADTDDDGDGVDDTRDTDPLDSSLTPPTAVLTLDINEGPAHCGSWSTHPAALQALAMTQSQATPGTLAMEAPLLKKQRLIFILRQAASRSL